MKESGCEFQGKKGNEREWKGMKGNERK